MFGSTDELESLEEAADAAGSFSNRYNSSKMIKLLSPAGRTRAHGRPLVKETKEATLHCTNSNQSKWN